MLECDNLTSNRFYAEGILRLYNAMSKRLSIGELLYDTAVSALGKVIEFQRDIIGPEVIITSKISIEIRLSAFNIFPFL
jgi:hypothetical protein